MKPIGSFVDGSGRVIGTISPAERRRRYAETKRRAEEIEGTVGSWPDPERPGVPLHPERTGVHWLRFPQKGQALTIAEWGSDLQMWVISYLNTTFGKPEELAFLNYVCEAEPPGPWILPE